VDRNELIFVLDAQVIQKLRRWWSVRLEIPRLVKYCVVTGLDDAGGGVQVHYVLVSGGVPQEDTCEVMVVKFTPPRA
jgi:hypothetical protein